MWGNLSREFLFGMILNDISAMSIRFGVWLGCCFGYVDSLLGSAFFASAKKADGKKAALRNRLCGAGSLGILLRDGAFALLRRKCADPSQYA